MNQNNWIKTNRCNVFFRSKPCSVSLVITENNVMTFVDCGFVSLVWQIYFEKQHHLLELLHVTPSHFQSYSVSFHTRSQTDPRRGTACSFLSSCHTFPLFNTLTRNKLLQLYFLWSDGYNCWSSTIKHAPKLSSTRNIEIF